MKKTLVVCCAVLTASAFAADGYMKKGYVTKDGTYVPPSYTTKPNGTKLDNYSAKGNINPYTGKPGTVDPYKIEPMKVPSYKPSKPPKY